MADNYCKCKGCRHIDPNDRSGYKWYCTWYRSYEDPDYVRECSRFENQDSTGGCFLTSACCKYRGLPDNCKELTGLRTFRDEHLMKTAEGRQLVEEYYRIAPDIVDKLDHHPHRDIIYAAIYSIISHIIGTIERKQFNLAIDQYRYMVLCTQFAVQEKGG